MVGFIGAFLQLQSIITAHTLNSFWTSLWRMLYEESLTNLSLHSDWSLLLEFKVKVTLRLTVSQSSGLGVKLMARYLLLFGTYGLVFVGRPLWRVYLLYMLLALASAVFLGSESLGIRDHILLSQIWDFPFRRLLRLAVSRWRYSTQPLHGKVLELNEWILYCDRRSVGQSVLE
jgi:hypothetical protein